MKGFGSFLYRAAGFLFLLGAVLVTGVQAESIKRPQKVISGQYLVTFSNSEQAKQSLSNERKASAHRFLQSAAQSLKADVVSELGSGVKLLKRKSRMARAVMAADGLLADVAEDDGSDTFCIDLMKVDPTVTCSPDFVVEAYDTVPNDPLQPEVWGLNGTQGSNGPGAWDISQGSDSIVVAIVDTGIDYNHADLNENAWVNPGEIAGNGLDDDGNGYIDDIHGMNAIANSGDPLDDNGHGTHVAGTIGARGDNGVGVAGVNWRVKLMGLKFLDARGSGSLSGAIAALNYMVMMKSRGVNIKVANNSWGGGGFSQSLYNAIAAARDAGIVFAAAAGNEANDNDLNPAYPASYALSNVIAVAAIDASRNLASFSNYGASSVDIAAPGVQIRSTFPNNLYQSLSGTSMATPHVSGAIALLAAIDPSLTAEGLKQRLLESGVDLPSLNGVVRTGRMLNLARMALNETSPLPSPTPTPVPCGFNVEEIAYSPDFSADSQPVVQQADEFSFHTVNLPFAFPFAGLPISTLKISPNGVLYAKGAPSGMDYQNGATAPLYSIAALHTDLLADGAPYGVRVKVLNDRVTVYWLAKHYDHRTEGSIEIRTSIYSDGRIEDFVTFSSAALADLVDHAATIGVSGPSANPDNTYAFNNGKVQMNTAVRFTPACSISPGVSRVKVHGIYRGKDIRWIRSRGRMHLSLRGYGSGSVSVTPKFNGRACPTSLSVDLLDGIGGVQLRMPNVSTRVQRLEFSAGSAAGSARVTNQTLRSKSYRGISNTELAGYCDSLLRSVAPAS